MAADSDRRPEGRSGGNRRMPNRLCQLAAAIAQSAPKNCLGVGRRRNDNRRREEVRCDGGQNLATSSVFQKNLGRVPGRGHDGGVAAAGGRVSLCVSHPLGSQFKSECAQQQQLVAVIAASCCSLGSGANCDNRPMMVNGGLASGYGGTADRWQRCCRHFTDSGRWIIFA
jgi:hypothetical protein